MGVWATFAVYKVDATFTEVCLYIKWMGAARMALT